MTRFPRLPAPLRGLLALLPVLLSSLAADDRTAAAPAAGLDSAPAALSPLAELDAIVARVQTKAQAGARSAEALAPEIADLDALVARTAAAPNEDSARIAMTRALLRAQLGTEMEQVVELLRTVVEGYPGTEAAAAAGQMMARAEAALAKQQAAARLVGNPAPEIDFTWSTAADLHHLSDLRGKVVVLDFWATWCGPCIRSFPQVRELTAHYADSPVAVVGVTSLQGRVHGLEATPINTAGDPAREHALMADFIAKHDVTWTVAFSRQKVFNEDYAVTGIPHLAIVAPDGTLRHSGLHPAMPHQEKTALIDAILREFDLPVPAAE